jgi:hypothetical protein
MGRVTPAVARQLLTQCAHACARVAGPQVRLLLLAAMAGACMTASAGRGNTQRALPPSKPAATAERLKPCLSHAQASISCSLVRPEPPSQRWDAASTPSSTAPTSSACSRASPCQRWAAPWAPMRPARVASWLSHTLVDLRRLAPASRPLEGRLGPLPHAHEARPRPAACLPGGPHAADVVPAPAAAVCRSCLGRCPCGRSRRTATSVRCLAGPAELQPSCAYGDRYLQPRLCHRPAALPCAARLACAAQTDGYLPTAEVAFIDEIFKVRRRTTAAHDT